MAQPMTLETRPPMPEKQSVSPEMWTDVVERIATIEEAIRRHDEREEEMKVRQVEILTSVRQIEHFIAKINGGARALIWVGGVFAAVGSAVTWIVSHLSVPWTWKP